MSELRGRLRRMVSKLRAFASLALVLGGACTDPDAYRRYAGSTMGTYYQVTARCPQNVLAMIEDELRRVNDDMSTYLPESALSIFNRSPARQWVAVSPELAEVVAAAQTLSGESRGAFDVTVGPLVNLWGFGPMERDGLPSSREVARARARVGYQRLEVERAPPRLRKHGDLYVDLSAIAKGHGVDRVVARLARAGCDAMLVDIGGEVKGVGPSPAKRPWRIGIEVPDAERQGSIQRIVRLAGGALATSGDYRNFLESDGRRYSHTIDPRTGYPVTHLLASVTVMHPSAMWADGYATLLNVLGPEDGLQFARRHDLAALFIVRGENGFQERYTEGLRAALID